MPWCAGLLTKRIREQEMRSRSWFPVKKSWKKFDRNWHTVSWTAVLRIYGVCFLRLVIWRREDRLAQIHLNWLFRIWKSAGCLSNRFGSGLEKLPKVTERLWMSFVMLFQGRILRRLKNCLVIISGIRSVSEIQLPQKKRIFIMEFFWGFLVISLIGWSNPMRSPELDTVTFWWRCRITVPE